MKQTAVEWLNEQLQIMDSKSFNNIIQIEMGRDNYKEIFEQAKAMEKEQIMDSYRIGARYALISQSDLALTKGEFPNPTEFYNETFKSE